jgi:hypothetical protein
MLVDIIQEQRTASTVAPPSSIRYEKKIRDRMALPVLDWPSNLFSCVATENSDRLVPAQ